MRAATASESSADSTRGLRRERFHEGCAPGEGVGHYWRRSISRNPRRRLHFGFSGPSGLGSHLLRLCKCRRRSSSLPLSSPESKASMPQWLNLPSIQKSYGVHTVAMGPCTRTSGFHIRSRIRLLDRLQMRESIPRSKSSGASVCRRASGRVKPPLRHQDLPRPLDILRGHGRRRKASIVFITASRSVGACA